MADAEPLTDIQIEMIQQTLADMTHFAGHAAKCADASRWYAKKHGQPMIAWNHTDVWLHECDKHLERAARLHVLVNEPMPVLIDLESRLDAIVATEPGESARCFARLFEDVLAVGADARRRAEAAMARTTAERTRAGRKGQYLGCLILLLLPLLFPPLFPGIRFLLTIPVVILTIIFELLAKALGL